MATQISSKPEKKASVTKHPLFPAVVALWFGSLFGLGSLAVRTSLIESLVLKLSLDVLLPAAAPPLGLKFQIILALLMAAIGIALGAALARQIARPRQVAAPRRREVGGRAAARQARAAAAAAAAEPADMTARRRPLTVTDEQDRAENYEHAPLPGSSPAILDVTQIDIGMNHDDSRGSFTAEQPVEAPLDLAAFSDPAPSAPEPQPEAPRFESARFEPVEFEPVNFEPVVIAPTQHHEPAAAAQPDYAPDRQVFRAAEPATAPEAELVAESAQPAPQGAQRLFDGAQPSAPVAEALNFDRPFDSLGEEPVVYEAQAFAPINFDPPFEAAPQTEAVFDTQEFASSDSASTMTDLCEINGDDAVAGQATLPVWSDEPPVSALQVPLADAPASSRIETAPLSELSPVELIERLALAMQQRTQLVAIPVELVDAVTAMARPVTDAAPVADFAAPGIFAEPQAAFEPETAELSAPEPELLPEPPAPELVIEPEQAPVAEAAETAESFAQLPAALRPIELSDFAEHDDLADLLLPPRSFGTRLFDQAAMAETQPAVLAADPAPEPEIEADVLEEGYSSLLDLGRPALVRSDFVRIEEPAADIEEIEPVVLFPGHAARPGMRFAAPGSVPTSQPADESAAPEEASDESGIPQLRRFDAPAKIASPVASGATGTAASALRQDPEEAQRALRAALATLQRMSGAA